VILFLIMENYFVRSLINTRSALFWFCGFYDYRYPNSPTVLSVLAKFKVWNIIIN